MLNGLVNVKFVSPSQKRKCRKSQYNSNTINVIHQIIYLFSLQFITYHTNKAKKKYNKNLLGSKKKPK